MLRKKTFESLSQKKTKNFFEWEGIERGINEEDKNKKNNRFDFYLFKKNEFRSLGGIKIGIQKKLKTDPTDREESRQPKSFSLTTGFFFFLFDRSRNKFDWSNPEESEFLKSLENFLQKHL